MCVFLLFKVLSFDFLNCTIAEEEEPLLMQLSAMKLRIIRERMRMKGISAKNFAQKREIYNDDESCVRAEYNDCTRIN